MQASPITIVIIIAYMIGCLVVGFWASKKQTSMSEFFVAGRRLGAMVTGLAVSSTIMSGFGWVGGFGTMYHTGLHLWTITISATAGTLFSYLIMAKPLRIYSEKYNMITLTDFYEIRYKSPAVSLIATIGIMCGMVGYLMTNMQALGKVGQALLGVDYRITLVIGTIILAVYCVGGGMLASAITDAFQAIMMVVSSIIFIVVALVQGGGLTNINNTIMSINPTQLLFWHESGSYNAVWAIGTILIYVFGVSAQPHVVSKFYQINKVGHIGRCMIIGVVSYFIVGLAMWAGLASRALTEFGLFPDMTGQGDLVSTMFATTFMPPIVAGLVMGAVMAAIMSTTDGIICSISATFSKDIWFKYFDKKEKSDKQQVTTARIISIIFIIIGFLLVLHPLTVVTWLGNGAWAILSAVNIPLLVIGLKWKRGTTTGALVSACVALFGSLGMLVAKSAFGVVFPVDFTIIACASSTLAYVIVSLCTKPTDNLIFPIESAQ